MAPPADPSRFQNLTFDGFRALAADDALSPSERIGFPDSYRSGHEDAIRSDWAAKLPGLQRAGAVVVDIGCGCSPLTVRLAEEAQRRGQHLHLVDSQEMLDRLPPSTARLVPGRYPDCAEALRAVEGQADAVLVYSVLQYVFVESSLFGFVDRLVGLLRPGGRALLGDLPNTSMRRRFLAGEAGNAFQRAGGIEPVAQPRFEIARDLMDDAVVLGLAARVRAAGFHAWVVPQAQGLPMANRREDLLIERP